MLFVALLILIVFTGCKRVVGIGNNPFCIGILEGHDVFLVKSGVGKFLSAACTAILLNEFNISKLYLQVLLVALVTIKILQILLFLLP